MNDGEENIKAAGEPAPTEESPAETAPAQPIAAAATPVEPAAVEEPAVEEPTAVEPVPVEPVPVEPAAVEPAAAEVAPTSMETAPVPATAVEGALPMAPPFAGPPPMAPPFAGPPMMGPPMMGPAGYPLYGPPMAPPRTGPRFSTRQKLFALGVLNVVLLATLAVVGIDKVADGSDDHPVVAAPTAIVPATPWDEVTEVLRSSAAALAAGDEKGWMAAVDPGSTELQTRYRAIYQELHTLGLTSFQYRPDIYSQDPADPSVFTFQTDAYYCFGTDTCHGDPDVPTIEQKLTMKPVDGHYVITASVIDVGSDIDGPAPWQDGKLQFVTGKRVILGAGAAEAKLLPSALPVAEKAAAVADKFAAMMGTTQLKYRIYLADPKQWKAWYGGEDATWTSRSVSLGQYGFDIIVNDHEIIDETDLQFALQRELGWSISLTGETSYSGLDETWLTEGVSTYIAFYPKPATADWYMPYVRKSVAGHAPTTMNPKRPADSASDATWNTFYGLAHLAIDCLATHYGQPKTFTFVKQTLINGEGYDEASQDAFKIPFSTVDKTCVGWIKNQV